MCVCGARRLAFHVNVTKLYANTFCESRQCLGCAARTDVLVKHSLDVGPCRTSASVCLDSFVFCSARRRLNGREHLAHCRAGFVASYGSGTYASGGGGSASKTCAKTVQSHATVTDIEVRPVSPSLFPFPLAFLPPPLPSPRAKEKWTPEADAVSSYRPVQLATRDSNAEVKAADVDDEGGYAMQMPTVTKTVIIREL